MQYSDGSAITKPLGGSAEFTTLFDQWRIAKVECKIIFSATNHQIVSSTQNVLAMPVVHIVTDYDDRDVASATFNAQEYPLCRTVRLDRIHRHTFYPRVRGYVQGSEVARAAGNDRSDWYDCAFADVDHFGMKVQYDNFADQLPSYDPDAVVGSCKFQFKIYYQLRNPR
jgi:hypothetical protein